MSFAGATAFANAEAECPNRINRVLYVVFVYFPNILIEHVGNFLTINFAILPF